MSKPKKKSTGKIVLITILCTIGALVLIPFLIGFFGGFTGLYDSYDYEYEQHLNDLSEEYDKHVDTHNEDSLIMEGILDKFSLQSISLDERIDVANEYIDYYNIRVNHLQDFLDFVVYNEDDLKLIGIDTFEAKQIIKDTDVILRDNIEDMRAYIERLIEYESQQLTQQQYDEYSQILELLTLLI